MNIHGAVYSNSMMTYLNNNNNLVNEYKIPYFTIAKIIKMSLLIKENKNQRQVSASNALILETP